MRDHVAGFCCDGEARATEVAVAGFVEMFQLQQALMHRVRSLVTPRPPPALKRELLDGVTSAGSVEDGDVSLAGQVRCL